MRPKALDLFCGAGGVALGLDRAGYDVVGVDVNPQPRYPFHFVHDDAIKILSDWTYLQQFALIWASPPCQGYSVANNCQKKEYPKMIPDVRQDLLASGRPFVIENVPGAPLIAPITLCGTMFGLKTYRHRLFETLERVDAPMVHPEHEQKAARGRKPGEDDFMTVFGHFSDQKRAKEAMGIPWMTRDELGEAIPPVYAEFIGRQLLGRPSDLLLYT
jgi:DNA (cytosine-5)-methyltransferase 1